MASPSRGTRKTVALTQRGTPEKPKLKFEPPYGAHKDIEGLDAFHDLPKGESLVVWAHLDPGVVVRYVAKTEEELDRLTARAAPEPTPTPRSEPMRTEPAPTPPRVKGPQSQLEGAFHNPYNFVPFVEREPPGSAPDLEPGLGDGAPAGHGAWEPHLHHGWLDLELTTATPLLVPDPESARADDKQHLSFDTLQRAGAPWIPPTTLKGAIRSAFECVTASRLPRFDSHELALGYRAPPVRGLTVVPVRVLHATESAGEVEILDGARRLPAIGSGNHPNPQPAAWLPFYRRDDPHVPPRRVRYADGTDPKHGDHVEVQLELMRHARRPFVYWVVRAIRRSGRGEEWGRARREDSSPSGARLSEAEAEGWVYLTHQSIRNKHDERVFLRRPADPETISAAGEGWTALCDKWAAVIASYRTAHTRREVWERRGKGRRPAAPDAYLGQEPGLTAWGPHVYERDWARLKEGTLAWARLGPATRNSGRSIVGLYPVSISRDLYRVSPVSLTPPFAHPATRWGEFSPADRVFGWVDAKRRKRAKVEGGSRDAASRTAPYRGHLRIGPVEPRPGKGCSASEFLVRHPSEGVPLAIMGAPKPQQFRFYVGDERGRATDRRAASRDYAGYAPGRRLRGRKVYPHHRHVDAIDGYWKAGRDKTFRTADGRTFWAEWRRTGDVRDSQNRSMRSWIRPGARFVARIHFENLASAELGALCWLLDPVEGESRHLRMGGGKPLGFGSVRTRILDSCTETGIDLAARYRSFPASPLGTASREEEAARRDELRGEFLQATELACRGDTRHLEAYRAASEGHDTGLPVHTPRTRPQPDVKGENFKWFQANDDERNWYTLGDLPGDPGLPYLDPPERGGRRGSSSRGHGGRGPKRR